MKYTTKNEFEHFNFAEAYIGDVQVTSGFFHMVLDNVTILPENSCNRDIREMRANNLILKIEDFSVLSVVEEGFKTYNADGKLIGICEDVEIAPEEQLDVIKTFADGVLYSLEKCDAQYIFNIDAANERSYVLTVEGSGDEEAWDRFLNKE